MPKLSADETHIWTVEDFLAEHPAIAHLRPRKRGDTITLESGPKTDPVPHGRVRRVTTQWWSIELPDHRGRWGEASFERKTLRQTLEVLHRDFPWALTPRV
jgi:hypothetical protein